MTERFTAMSSRRTRHTCARQFCRQPVVALLPWQCEKCNYGREWLACAEHAAEFNQAVASTDCGRCGTPITMGEPVSL